MHAEHARLRGPLQRFRVSVAGSGARPTPIRPRRCAASRESRSRSRSTSSGRPTGSPTHGAPSTRYEIPCRVSGSVRVGEEEIAFAGPGQRDHSWGARDWWAVDWMWSALHLEDGTRTHAVGVPQMPGYGVGYVQRGGELTEIESVTAGEQVAANGLITSARIVSRPTGARARDRAARVRRDPPRRARRAALLFPRAMCRVQAEDGRTGVGWVEWNRVQRRGGDGA